MLNDTIRRRVIAALSVLALAFVTVTCASVAHAAPASGDDSAAAQAFVHLLASGKFTQAEASFTTQMKTAMGPNGLEQLWSQLLQSYGAFESTGALKTDVVNGYPVVTVRTNFKNQAVGLAVAFDPSHRIAGLHLVPPP